MNLFDAATSSNSMFAVRFVHSNALGTSQTRESLNEMPELALCENKEEVK